MKTGFSDLWRLLVTVMVLTAGIAFAGPVKVPGLDTPVELSLPENHDPAKSWPVVFFYHGLGAPPSTDIIRKAAGKRDWIVVGMEYSTPGNVNLSAEGMRSEIAILHQVQAELARKYGADPKRTYVSGFSLGGWVTNHFFRLDRSLAGAAILGAGRSPDIVRNLPPFRAGTPLFVGIGRSDSSYPFALKAGLSYAREGATICMETWTGLGHDYPAEGSTGLKEWFALQNGGAPDEPALKEEFARIGKLPPLEQWRALVAFADRPYVNVPGEPWPETIQVRIVELQKDPSVAPQARLFNQHLRLLVEEAMSLTLDGLAKVVAGYADLAAQITTHGLEEDLIAADKKRVEDLLVMLRNRAGQR
jgi:predicted esterase